MTVILLAFNLYYTPEMLGDKTPLMARYILRTSDDDPNAHDLSMEPCRVSSDRYRLELIPRPDPDLPGWLSYRIQLNHNMDYLGDMYGGYPLSIFVGEPTDWNTGLVRLRAPVGPWLPQSYSPSTPGRPMRPTAPPQRAEPGTWILTARRSS